MAARMKMAVFRVAAPLSVIKVTGVSEVFATSETSVNFYLTARPKSQEDSHLRNPNSSLNLNLVIHLCSLNYVLCLGMVSSGLQIAGLYLPICDLVQSIVNRWHVQWCPAVQVVCMTANKRLE
jgi:hypothetical protein